MHYESLELSERLGEAVAAAEAVQAEAAQAEVAGGEAVQADQDSLTR
jgi:hypothetical protein